MKEYFEKMYQKVLENEKDLGTEKSYLKDNSYIRDLMLDEIDYDLADWLRDVKKLK